MYIELGVAPCPAMIVTVGTTTTVEVGEGCSIDVDVTADSSTVVDVACEPSTVVEGPFSTIVDVGVVGSNAIGGPQTGSQYGYATHPSPVSVPCPEHRQPVATEAGTAEGPPLASTEQRTTTVGESAVVAGADSGDADADADPEVAHT